MVELIILKILSLLDFILAFIFSFISSLKSYSLYPSSPGLYIACIFKDGYNLELYSLSISL